MTVFSLGLYALTIFVVSIVPGPSMALAFSHGAKYGTAGFIPAALGNMTASLMQSVLAMLMLKNLVSLNNYFLLVLQFIGAVYIGYIGTAFILNGSKIVIGFQQGFEAKGNNVTRFFAGFFIALFNPKAIFFFVALFPQFFGQSGFSFVQYFKIFFPVGLIAFVCFSIYGIVGSYSIVFFKNSKTIGYIISALGGFLIVLAVYGLYDVLLVK